MEKALVAIVLSSPVVIIGLVSLGFYSHVDMLVYSFWLVFGSFLFQCIIFWNYEEAYFFEEEEHEYYTMYTIENSN